MIRDLRQILDGWTYEPGKISVRKILGRDGREKIQTRIDLGVMQLELTGRPDGARPHDCESLLEHHEQRLHQHLDIHGNDDDFVLAPEDCRDLRHEAYLYYQRYLAFFVLEEYDGVVRDTARNLRVIDLCERYAATPRDREVLRPQRPYVMMMHALAAALHALARGKAPAALRIVERGLADLDRLRTDAHEEDTCGHELATLHALRRDVLERLPDGAPARLRSQLEAALAAEDYERAAALRDQLTHGSEPSTSA